MSEQFHFENYKNHSFYHARLGRGAVVVVVSNNPENGIEAGCVNSDLHVAGFFCSREQNLEEKPQHLDPVRSIKENEGFVEIEIEFTRRRTSGPHIQSMSAVVKRVVPQNQVTLEVIEKNNSVSQSRESRSRVTR